MTRIKQSLNSPLPSSGVVTVAVVAAVWGLDTVVANCRGLCVPHGSGERYSKDTDEETPAVFNARESSARLLGFYVAMATVAS